MTGHLVAWFLWIFIWFLSIFGVVFFVYVLCQGLARRFRDRDAVRYQAEVDEANWQNERWRHGR